MDNYKYSKAFERLAIKIVEEHFQFKLDYEKTHVTQATRDYGIDSVLFFSDRNIYSSTIEAKLRKNEYTLSLKDIASSILFFLVRKGNEHFIVSNVYITEGTIETLELLSLQSKEKIYYIDGEKTKNALEKLIYKLTDLEEKELAQELIENFTKLKRPKTNRSNSKSISETQINLLESRYIYLKKLIKCIQDSKKIIIFRGSIGTGKRMILQQLNYALDKSIYKIITIDVYVNNTIDTFCYEITQKVLGLDLKNILYMFTKSEIDYIKQSLTDIETEELDYIFKIFNNNQISNEVAIYLAKLYLKLIFEKCNQLRYVLEIVNYSYTSQEVYNFIRDFAVDAPSNISILFVFSEDISSTNSVFSTRFKQLYKNIIKEIYIDKLSIEESAQYLKSFIPQMEDKIVQQIYEYTKGTPSLLKAVASQLQKRVLHNNATVSECLSSLDIYLNRDFVSIIENNYYAEKFFFLLYIYSFKLNKSTWKKIEIYDNFEQEHIQSFCNIFFEDFLDKTDSYYTLKNVYMYSYIENYYESNANAFRDYAKKIKDIIFSNEIPVSTKIKILFFCNDENLISEYESSKQLWMYKSNISWQISSLKYICKFLYQNETENLKYVLNSLKYYLEYLSVKDFYGDFENRLFEKIIQYKIVLEDNFSNIHSDYIHIVADLLADYYVYQYYYYRQQSKYDTILKILENAIIEEWFLISSDIKKIKLMRFIALLYKSQGNRDKFIEILKNILSTYKDDSYAKLIYWANVAAIYYTENPMIANTYIEKCELDAFIQDYPNEQKLYLWVYNDKGIVSFYSNDIITAKEISKKILNKSEKINYLENIARSHNVLGAIALKEGDFDEAKKQFYNAFTMCINEKSEAFFHFAVNYLVTNNSLELLIIELIMDYVKIHHTRLLHIFETEKLESCRWFITLYSFNQYLSNVAPQLQKELEIIFKETLKSIPSSNLEKYIIQDLLIVLF